jgi:hypothetical protein
MKLQGADGDKFIHALRKSAIDIIQGSDQLTFLIIMQKSLNYYLKYNLSLDNPRKCFLVQFTPKLYCLVQFTLNTICLFYFFMHKWTFKFKFCKMVADNISRVKNIYYEFSLLFL